MQNSNNSWRMQALRRITAYQIMPTDTIEFHLTADKRDGDIFSLAKRTVQAFFMMTLVQPAAIIVHPTVAQLFEERGETFRVDTLGMPDSLKEMIGEGFIVQPIPVESDGRMDTRTVAVRFAINMDEYQDEAKQFAVELLMGLARGRGNE